MTGSPLPRLPLALEGRESATAALSSLLLLSGAVGPRAGEPDADSPLPPRMLPHLLALACKCLRSVGFAETAARVMRTVQAHRDDPGSALREIDAALRQVAALPESGPTPEPAESGAEGPAQEEAAAPGETIPREEAMVLGVTTLAAAGIVAGMRSPANTPAEDEAAVRDLLALSRKAILALLAEDPHHKGFRQLLERNGILQRMSGRALLEHLRSPQGHHRGEGNGRMAAETAEPTETTETTETAEPAETTETTETTERKSPPRIQVVLGPRAAALGAMAALRMVALAALGGSRTPDPVYCGTASSGARFAGKCLRRLGMDAEASRVEAATDRLEESPKAAARAARAAMTRIPRDDEGIAALGPPRPAEALGEDEALYAVGAMVNLACSAARGILQGKEPGREPWEGPGDTETVRGLLSGAVGLARRLADAGLGGAGIRSALRCVEGHEGWSDQELLERLAEPLPEGPEREPPREEGSGSGPDEKAELALDPMATAMSALALLQTLGAEALSGDPERVRDALPVAELACKCLRNMRMEGAAGRVERAMEARTAKGIHKEVLKALKALPRTIPEMERAMADDPETLSLDEARELGPAAMAAADATARVMLEADDAHHLAGLEREARGLVDVGLGAASALQRVFPEEKGPKKVLEGFSEHRSWSAEELARRLASFPEALEKG